MAKIVQLHGRRHSESGSPPNELPLSRRERRALPAKMQTISCAKRSATAACWAAESGSMALQAAFSALRSLQHISWRRAYLLFGFKVAQFSWQTDYDAGQPKA